MIISDKKEERKNIPLLSLRDIVVFPHMVAPLFVGRAKSVRALDEVVRADKPIFLATQKDASIDEPQIEDIYDCGVVANLLQLLKLPDGAVKVMVEGLERAKITHFHDRDEFFEVDLKIMQDKMGDATVASAMVRTVHKEFRRYAKLSSNIPKEAVFSVEKLDDPFKLADTVAGYLNINIPEKQNLLTIDSVDERLEQIYGILQGEIDMAQVERKIKSRVKHQMERTQREYYLNEQMKAIQRELGDRERGGGNDLEELEEQIKNTRLSKEAREKAEADLRKLRQMAPMSAESTVVRNYLDWILNIPWAKKSRLRKDLAAAEKVLDNDHYGLEKIKERIVEYLAVQVRAGKARGPILCLVGPPGVGKTSLGKSIARATGREFIRISLGGVRDEAEIRGHRRTYIGSMPGKIIQAMKKAKTVNPVIMLDEIDKMGRDFRGDPASALLEVLDPEQNQAFADHYLEVDYDLSNVMFITTANGYEMPRPLLDRMEIISISGYTEDEKLEILKRHLIPKQMKEHKLHAKEFGIGDDAIRHIIRRYTREAGVRNLERMLAKLCRKVVALIQRGKAPEEPSIGIEQLEDLLGVPKYRFGLAEERDNVGAATGMAWTETGGDLLTIEALKLPGKGQKKATGKLGDVMKESIDAASSYVRANAPELGLRPPIFEHLDIHVHVPEGATPKDGPSAGVAMVTAMVSVLTGIAVRRDVAMTGEVTLRGNVLAIGGLKEKLLAALRGGIKTILIPKENEKDLKEMPDNIIEQLDIKPVAHVREVLQVALVQQPKAIEWDIEGEFEKSLVASAKGHADSERPAH